ncbi:hypothetical protein J6590_102028 [Homalodisca vitripennis]|nr:hypothetical protein J6590_102028 [Homalodisca vitripennis]
MFGAAASTSNCVWRKRKATQNKFTFKEAKKLLRSHRVEDREKKSSHRSETESRKVEDECNRFLNRLRVGETERRRYLELCTLYKIGKQDLNKNSTRNLFGDEGGGEEDCGSGGETSGVGVSNLRGRFLRRSGDTADNKNRRPTARTSPGSGRIYFITVWVGVSNNPGCTTGTRRPDSILLCLPPAAGEQHDSSVVGQERLADLMIMKLYFVVRYVYQTLLEDESAADGATEDRLRRPVIVVQQVPQPGSSSSTLWFEKMKEKILMGKDAYSRSLSSAIEKSHTPCILYHANKTPWKTTRCPHFCYLSVNLIHSSTTDKLVSRPFPYPCEPTRRRLGLGLILHKRVIGILFTGNNGFDPWTENTIIRCAHGPNDRKHNKFTISLNGCEQAAKTLLYLHRTTIVPSGTTVPETTKPTVGHGNLVVTGRTVLVSTDHRLMPRTYKRDSRAKHHRHVDEEAIKRALDAVAKGMSIRKLKSNLKSQNQRCTDTQKKARSGRELTFKKKGGQTALDSKLEQEIGASLSKCGEWGYPLSTFDVRCFVKYHLDREGKNVPVVRGE